MVTLGRTALYSCSGFSSTNRSGYIFSVNARFDTNGLHRSSMCLVHCASFRIVLLRSSSKMSVFEMMSVTAFSLYMNNMRFARNGEPLVPTGMPHVWRTILSPTWIHKLSSSSIHLFPRSGVTTFTFLCAVVALLQSTVVCVGLLLLCTRMYPQCFVSFTYCFVGVRKDCARAFLQYRIQV